MYRPTYLHVVCGAPQTTCRRYGFSVLYVALLVEVIEELKSMDQEERNKALSIISRKAYSIK
ncbi:hypothetical protein RCD19_27670, partial [Klebsiella pneumoniae]|nr:hypothetical protein [Klebsiella pneumoniae]